MTDYPADRRPGSTAPAGRRARGPATGEPAQRGTGRAAGRRDIATSTSGVGEDRDAGSATPSEASGAPEAETTPASGATALRGPHSTTPADAATVVVSDGRGADRREVLGREVVGREVVGRDVDGQELDEDAVGGHETDSAPRAPRPSTSAPSTARSVTERALSEEVEALSEATARLGRTFAHAHELHDTDFRALSLIHVGELHGHSVTPAMLGAQLGLSSGAVTYLLDRLERGGHVVRSKDPRDGRRVLLHYADHGREVVGEFFGPLGFHQHAALAAFDDEEIETARRVLRAVTESVRAYHDDLECPAGTSPPKGSDPTRRR